MRNSHSRRRALMRAFTLREFFVVFAIVAIVISLLAISIRSGSLSSSNRMRCSNNLRQIQLALLNYEAQHHSFPPAYTVDAHGNRMHSWRTLILPQLEQSALYAEIDLSVAWDHPNNAKLLNTLVPVYQCPAAKLGPGLTTYVGIVDPQAAFVGASPTKQESFTDGSHRTVMIYETTSDKSIRWMEPTDGNIDDFVTAVTMPVNSKNRRSHTITNCAVVECATSWLANSLSKDQLRALATRNGNEPNEAYPESQ